MRKLFDLKQHKQDFSLLTACITDSSWLLWMFGRQLVSISMSFCRSGAAVLSQADDCAFSVLQMRHAVWGDGWGSLCHPLQGKSVREAFAAQHCICGRVRLIYHRGTFNRRESK